MTTDRTDAFPIWLRRLTQAQLKSVGVRLIPSMEGIGLTPIAPGLLRRKHPGVDQALASHHGGFPGIRGVHPCMLFDASWRRIFSTALEGLVSTADATRSCTAEKAREVEKCASMMQSQRASRSDASASSRL